VGDGTCIKEATPFNTDVNIVKIEPKLILNIFGINSVGLGIYFVEKGI
jgi:hypothetical protein